MQNISVIQSPLGKLKLIVNEQALDKIELDCQEDLLPPTTKFAQLIVEQLNDYFDSPDYRFDLAVQSQGTEFQNKVWEMLKQIPVGEVWTYGELAKKINSSARAVGNACRHNPIPIIVPCHRIVSASGLGGFAGQTEGPLTRIKKMLLKHEGVTGVE